MNLKFLVNINGQCTREISEYGNKILKTLNSKKRDIAYPEAIELMMRRRDYSISMILYEIITVKLRLGSVHNAG